MKAKKLLFLTCLTATSIGFAMNKERVADYSGSYDPGSVDNLKIAYYKNLYGKSVTNINIYQLLSLAFQNDKINFSSHHSNDENYCNEIEQNMKFLTIDTIYFDGEYEPLKIMDIRPLEEAIHKKINKPQPKTSDSKRNLHLGQKPLTKTSIPKFYYGLGVGIVGTLAALKLLSWVRPAEQP